MRVTFHSEKPNLNKKMKQTKPKQNHSKLTKTLISFFIGKIWIFLPLESQTHLLYDIALTGYYQGEIWLIPGNEFSSKLCIFPTYSYVLFHQD